MTTHHYKGLFNLMLLLLFVSIFFVFMPQSHASIKKITIDDSGVTVPDGYSIYVSGICRVSSGIYGLVSFSVSGSNITTGNCEITKSTNSSTSPYFAKVAKANAASATLQIASPIKSGRFYFYLAKTGTTPDWSLLTTNDKGLLSQPNVAQLLTNNSALYPFAVIEITKDSTGNQTYYGDGTLIDGVSPLFASIHKTDATGSIRSGYNIPDGIKTSKIISTVIDACSGDSSIPSKTLCKANITNAGRDKLNNQWIISPTQLDASVFKAPIDASTQTYLKALNGISWNKSTYCGTFYIGDGSDANCPLDTLCSTLGQFYSNQCFDQDSANPDSKPPQYPIMFNSTHGPKEGQACIVKALSTDGSYWMESPCWDLRTVYAAAMPAASKDCAKWPKYSNLAKQDAYLAKGVKITLTPKQQENRGACAINAGNTSVGQCPYSLVDCNSFIKSFNGNYTEPECQKGGDPLKFLRCSCPTSYTKTFSDKNSNDTLCQNPESINAISSWASVFLAATPDLSGSEGLLQSSCTKNGNTLLTPECVANYITSPQNPIIQDTSTHLFSSTYYSWLLQFLFIDKGVLTFPTFDKSTGKTTITDTTKADYLSGFGPTYVFPFSDFVSGDKALLTWQDNDNSTITIKLNYSTK